MLTDEQKQEQLQQWAEFENAYYAWSKNNPKDPSPDITETLSIAREWIAAGLDTSIMLTESLIRFAEERASRSLHGVMLKEAFKKMLTKPPPKS